MMGNRNHYSNQSEINTTCGRHLPLLDMHKKKQFEYILQQLCELQGLLTGSVIMFPGRGHFDRQREHS